MKPVTQGEEMFLLIRDRVLDTTGTGHLRWSAVGALWDDVMGAQAFSRYFKGAVAVHALRRLLQFWAAERDNTPDQAMYVSKVRHFIRGEVFIGLDDALANRLARLVISAEAASRSSVSRTTREAVFAGRVLLNCYLCANTLDARVSQEDPLYATVEHIWPKSIGGDSIERNLLPACHSCQDVTKDTMSWEWFNVHNLVLPPTPSAAALGAITKKAKVAKHFMHAADLADEENLTMKDALLRLGRVKDPLTYIDRRLPVTFFDLQTT
jgi:5-methylcytosine-specific restriction endonuclease McrA